MILFRKSIPPFKIVMEKYPLHFTALQRPWNYLWCCYVRAPMPPISKGKGAVPRHAPPFRRPCWDKSVSNPKTPERRFVGNYELQSHHHHQVLLEQIIKAFWNFHNWNELLQCSNSPPEYLGPKIRSIGHQFPARLRSNRLLCHCPDVLSLQYHSHR